MQPGVGRNLLEKEETQEHPLRLNNVIVSKESQTGWF